MKKKNVKKSRSFLRELAVAVSGMVLVVAAVFVLTKKPESLKNQCFYVEKSELSVGGLPLVGHSMQIDTDEKRFKYGYGATLDVGLPLYFTKTQLKSDGVVQIDCEIYLNNSLKYAEENKSENK